MVPLVSLALAALSAVLVRVMIGVGTLDHPGARSSHSVPTPKGGGVGIVAAFSIGLLVFLRDGSASPTEAREGWGLLAGAVFLAVISYLDDVRNWPFLAKLAAQLAASALLIGSGLSFSAVTLPGVETIDLGPFGPALTVIWLLYTTNAVNFMDGLNGLVGSTLLIACLFVAVLAGPGLAANASLALAAGLAGFLPFNTPRARIFMGDVGSQACGFVMAALGVLETRQVLGRPAMFLVPLLLWPLLFDVGVTLVRRALRRENLTQAHRSHLYQRAHQNGMRDWVVTLTYCGMTAWAGILALVASERLAPARLVLLAAAMAPPPIWMAAVARASRRHGRPGPGVAPPGKSPGGGAP